MRHTVRYRETGLVLADCETLVEALEAINAYCEANGFIKPNSQNVTDIYVETCDDDIPYDLCVSNLDYNFGITYE